MDALYKLLAILAGVFPFFAVGAKLAATESSVVVIVYGVVVLILAATLLIASRIVVERPVAAPAAPRPPARPIAWSWDGVDRQPEGEEIDARDS